MRASFKVNGDYKRWNAEAEKADENSVLMFWQKILKLRKAHSGLVLGAPRDQGSHF